MNMFMLLQAIPEEPFFGPSLLVFATIGVGVLLCLADGYTTMLGFEVGLKERHPIPRWFQQKIGQQLYTVLKTAAYILTAAAFYGVSDSPWYSVSFSIAVIAGLIWRTVGNYRLYRAAKGK